MPEPRFVHLHLHSEYSLSDGIIRLEPLVNTVSDQNMVAVAITDQSNLFATVKFYQEARAAGIKPIIGADIFICAKGNAKRFTAMTLLCQNNSGYLNLIALLSRAYQEGQGNGRPCIDPEWLNPKTCEGLIALAGIRSDLGALLLNASVPEAGEMLGTWKTLFPHRFYIELVRTDKPEENTYIHQALQLARAAQVPVVATNDVRFLTASDFDAHEARVCIYEGLVLNDPKRPRSYTAAQYLRSEAEMVALFADIPEALINSVEIAKRCNVTLSLGESYLPNFPIPPGSDLKTYFLQQAELGLEKRFKRMLNLNNPEVKETYVTRLHRELEVINRMGFAGYFLIVADFVQWAKDNGVPVGPGRGSGAGSLVAYALGITDLDPIHYALLFERFLNPERVSMPDFDIDFCMEGRDKVIDYVAKRYGRESVSQIITYGTMAAKAVVRDVGRVLGLPYGYVDKIAKLIPFELGITLEKALAQDEVFRSRYQTEEDVQTLIDLALKLEGIVRNAGKHAGGVVIAPSKLTDFTPLYCESDGSSLITQFDKDDVEAVGLVKFDFLGLRTLTIIDWAVKAVNETLKQQGKPLIDINAIPLDDAATFKLLQSCQTTAVFQFESRGMKDLIKRFVPDQFEDIISLGAIFRPGPLQSGMVDDFIDRKHGRAIVAYLHPDLEPILNTTYGVIVYQEQVMQIAQVLAGYTLGAADLLRRAMGKKKPEEMAKQRAVFLAGASKRGVNATIASHIFDLMEKFAGYGFNRSHSAAYALLSYQTAWLKAHYPSEFMAAVLSSDMDHTDKVVRLIDECKQLGIPIIAPDINHSEYYFTVNIRGEIVYGLGAIKGVGESGVETIVRARQQGGPFSDLFDFCSRIDLSAVNRRALESLIRSGAMDSLKIHRASLAATLERAIHSIEQAAMAKEAGQLDLFSLLEEESPTPLAVHYIEAPLLSDVLRLQGEKETLGLYFSGHPLKAYETELSYFVTTSIANLRPARDKPILIAGMIAAVRTLQTKRGDRMAFITIDDQTARMEIAVFSDLYHSVRPLIIKDNLVIVEGEVSIDEYSGGYKMSARSIYTITEARERYARYLKLDLQQQDAKDIIEQLQLSLKPFCGGKCPIQVYYQREGARAAFMLGEQWRVRLEDTLLSELRELLGKDRVVVCYEEVQAESRMRYNMLGTVEKAE
ncbi:MAG: polymerase subunit alpha [Gammaproteobacteria bacterium]|jgi:DNA polymerase-3 subunit alpha|nr:polymerase subunit alpha [Gammaproteobacteria bacterium]